MTEQIRDQFFALRRAGTNASEAASRRLIAEVDALDAEPTTTLQGLSLSFFPSARFKQLRFVEAAELASEVRPLFARPCAELPELAAVFVDPEEFSYRSFETIVGLDRLFSELGDRPIRLAKPKRQGHRSIWRMNVRLDEPLRARLEQLDQLDLYVAPLDPSARGGVRFIFHAAELAAALTAALRESLPSTLLAGFVHVNPVFRCNRFEPNDFRFRAHVDSPYYHRSRHHVSKYTLLVYLTGGRGEGVLRFGDELKIDSIEAMTAFVFPQQLAHEGAAYLDGRKLFLRTELIFEDKRIEHDPGIAELFAKACYLSLGFTQAAASQSVFAPELARFAQAAYDRAAAAHWLGPDGRVDVEPFIHKRFHDLHFLTNGYDYWFRKGDLSLIECAAITLLDLLNAKLDDAPFHTLCTTEVLARAGGDLGWISEFLAGFGPTAESTREFAFAKLDKSALCPKPEEPDESSGYPTSPDFRADPFPNDWDATRNPGVVKAYARARRYAMKRIFAAPITMLGKQVFLDPKRFVVASDKIHVLSSESLGPVHFAGAVFFDDLDFVGVDVAIDTLQPLVPPMFVRETTDLIHLTCDLFRNSWMVSQRSERVPVPRVLDGLDVEPDQAPWLYAAPGTATQIRAELDAKD